MQDHAKTLRDATLWVQIMEILDFDLHPATEIAALSDDARFTPAVLEEALDALVRAGTVCATWIEIAGIHVRGYARVRTAQGGVPMAGLDYEVTTDERTVWVNDAGGTIGRFGPMGVDVHNKTCEVLAGRELCADCTTTPDWSRFVASMLATHGITIPEDFRPEWCTP